MSSPIAEQDDAAGDAEGVDGDAERVQQRAARVGERQQHEQRHQQRPPQDAPLAVARHARGLAREERDAAERVDDREQRRQGKEGESGQVHGGLRSGARGLARRRGAACSIVRQHGRKSPLAGKPSARAGRPALTRQVLLDPPVRHQPDHRHQHVDRRRRLPAATKASATPTR